MGRFFQGPDRSVLHFNVADFAVAVERIADSSLREKPLIIAPLHAARAVVYDMSEESYLEGVRKGMLVKDAVRRCRAATVLPPRTALYQKAMGAFFKELHQYSPLLERGQDDGHFFVDVTGTHRLHGPAPDIGWRVRRHVRSGLGINPIWTLGTSKLVAKVASRLVKPVGEYIVEAGDEASFLAPLPVALLPGLTSREHIVLREFQLSTIGAESQLMIPFGTRSSTLHRLSLGIDDSVVGGQGGKTQPVIDCEHSFAGDTNDVGEVEAVLMALAGRAARELRDRGAEARRVGVWLRYSDGGHIVRQASSRVATAADFRLYQLALAALQRAWLRRTRLRSCRLVCDRLQKKSPQLSLFPEGELHLQRQTQVHSAIDRLRDRFGDGIIATGREAGERERLKAADGGMLSLAV